MSPLEEINKKLEKLYKLDTICDEINEIKSTCFSIETKQQQNELKILSNSTHIDELVNIIEHLSSDVNHLQYNKIVNNLIINGIPFKSDEVPNQLATELFTHVLDSKIDSRIIQSSRRMKLNNNATPPLVICLVDNKMKNQIIKKWSEKKASDIFQKKIKAHFIINDSDYISIAEEKTNFINSLYKQARFQLKDNYKFIWVKYGHLNVRESESSPIIRLKNRKDLERIKQDITAYQK